MNASKAPPSATSDVKTHLALTDADVTLDSICHVIKSLAKVRALLRNTRQQFYLEYDNIND